MAERFSPLHICVADGAAAGGKESCLKDVMEFPPARDCRAVAMGFERHSYVPLSRVLRMGENIIWKILHCFPSARDFAFWQNLAGNGVLRGGALM
ncbi:MAG: hypothetical protein ACTTKL_11595 [Treponema sp.]